MGYCSPVVVYLDCAQHYRLLFRKLARDIDARPEYRVAYTDLTKSGGKSVDVLNQVKNAMNYNTIATADLITVCMVSSSKIYIPIRMDKLKSSLYTSWGISSKIANPPIVTVR